MYKVISVDLDMPRKGADYSDWYPHVDGAGKDECPTLEIAIELVEEYRESLYCDAKIQGENVPKNYAQFDCSWSYSR